MAATILDTLIPPGMLMPTAATLLVVPPGWLLCDGSAVNRLTYAALFDVLGTTYGVGDGVTTFNLPNLKGRVIVGQDVGQTEFAARGQTSGSKTSTASHTHTMGNHSHTLTSGGPSNNTTTNQSVDHNHGNTGGISDNHSHTVNAHAHGGGTGVHAHRCLNNVYVTGTPAHGHDGAGDQSSERPNATTGFSSPGNITDSVGVGNSSEAPGTSIQSHDHVHATGGVNNNHTHDMQSHTHSGTSAGPSNNTSDDSSVAAASGNLQPYIVMSYLVKV